ncbi:hypothetical protein LHYA1_G002961, partial [Lachnellula hyalina]
MPSPAPGSNLSSLSSNPSFKTAHSTLTTQKDFSYLLRPEIYHPLTLLDVPPPFRTTASQPDPSTPLEVLLSAGHFRSAAIKASQLLTAPQAPPTPTIFSLLYIRLSCLTLCNQTPLAAQEVKCLEDLNSSYYRDDESGVHLVPWNLRVLAVRLQGMGYADARRGVMGFYELAREARLALTSLKKTLAISPTSSISDEIALWEERLSELAIRVASALIEMQDLEGAAHFLDTSSPTSSPTQTLPPLQTQNALLYLCLGDVEAARSCIDTPTEDDAQDDAGKVILALAQMADGEFDACVQIWEELIASASTGGTDGGELAMYRQNLAVCLLYLGRMDHAKEALESLIDEGNSFHALTFNLSTIYELCTERSRALKIGLAERVAGMLVEGREGEGEGAGVG